MQGVLPSRPRSHKPGEPLTYAEAHAPYLTEKVTEASPWVTQSTPGCDCQHLKQADEAGGSAETEGSELGNVEARGQLVW